jgi:hypothetical protein
MHSPLPVALSSSKPPVTAPMLATPAESPTSDITKSINLTTETELATDPIEPQDSLTSAIAVDSTLGEKIDPPEDLNNGSSNQKVIAVVASVSVSVILLILIALIFCKRKLIVCKRKRDVLVRENRSHANEIRRASLSSTVTTGTWKSMFPFYE